MYKAFEEVKKQFPLVKLWMLKASVIPETYAGKPTVPPPQMAPACFHYRCDGSPVRA